MQQFSSSLTTTIYDDEKLGYSNLDLLRSKTYQT